MNINIDDKEDYITLLNGDILGFERLVLRYKNHLIYFLQKYVNNIDTAEDLAQDAFVEIFIHKERFQVNKNFKTYLFTIGKFKAIDFLRKQPDYTSIDEIETLADRNLLEEQLFSKEDKTILFTALNKLKPEYQQIITLIDLEDISYKDAAKILQKTLPQVKILIYRARKSLEKELVKTGYKHEK